MTEFERSVALMHWLNDLSLEDSAALLKGTGIAPIEEDA